jgi:exopolysaccharide biosynthesis WecB/TagA/CpsF family protein
VPLTESTVPATAITIASEAGSRKRPRYAKRDIGGIGIAVMEREAAIAEVTDAVLTGGHMKLAFCNANLVNVAADNAALQRSLSTFLVLADGIGVDLGSWMLYGEAFPANLNGTDFFPRLFAAAERPMRVALLGGRPGVADRAVANLTQRYPAHKFSVLSHGYFTADEEIVLLGKLKIQRPDLLLVAMGNPLQERFIADKLGPQHASVAAGVGALFDFFADEVPRAPELVRQIRLEWMYRLWLEPRRLWRRYVLGNPAFLMRMARQYAVGGRRSG